MTDYAQIYRALRGRVCDLVRDADEEKLERLAPAAPEWRVRDLVAHLSGITADINAGNLDGVATDAWTARQVDARRDWPIDGILEEWDTHSAKVEPLMTGMPEGPVRQMLFDAATHEHDIRGALDRPGARDSDAMALAFDSGLYGLAAAVEPADITLRLETDIASTTLGTGSRNMGLRIDSFELFRSFTGRRSLDQMRAFDWDGDAAPELLVFGMFTPRSTPLVE
jgi:uncharacterized protein (TIGR03083 family)